MITVIKIKDKLSDTTVYLYIARFIMMLSDVLKRNSKAILIEIFMVTSIIGEYVVTQAFGDGLISFVVTMIFLAILGVIVMLY